MRFIATITLLMLLAVPALAAEPVFKVYAAANGIWYDAVELVGALPPDLEVGATGRASLSPNISGVGAAYYGFDNSYTRGSIGVRFTATDANDPNFSIGVGIQRHFSSEPRVRPQEWAPDATIGYRPWPDSMPQAVLVAQGFYGLDSHQASVLVGARYALTGGGK